MLYLPRTDWLSSFSKPLLLITLGVIIVITISVNWIGSTTYGTEVITRGVCSTCHGESRIFQTNPGCQSGCHEMSGTTSASVPHAGWDGVSLGGYASAVSVAQGEIIDFYISTDIATYDINVYREGASRQLMTTISDLTGAFYDCAGGYETGCGWPVAHSLTVPPSWPSGVYTVDFPTSVGTRSLIFWVREDQPGSTSDLLFLSSVLTYQAYNPFGGKSLYDFNSTDEKQSYKVSFDRPYGKPGLGDFAMWEEYFVRWAEAEGYSMEYATTYDIMFMPDLLNNYEVVIIAGHSEYWSWDMRQRIKAFVNDGGRFINLSGNTMWWQTRLEDAGRTLVVYRDYRKDPATEPEAETDYNWDHPIYDAENTIIGASFRHGGYVNTSGYYDYNNGYGGYWINKADHWVFAGTTLSNGDIFGRTGSSFTAIVGSEVDGTLFNCALDGQMITGPLGTDGTPDNFAILGASPASDGFSVMGIYTTPGGGAVFSANTLRWARGLAVDNDVATVTRNILDRFLANNFSQEPINPDTAYYFYDRFNCDNLTYGGKVEHNYNYVRNDAGAHYSAACGIGQGSGLQVDVNDAEVVILDTPIRPNWQPADVVYSRLYVDVSGLTMSDGNEFNILRWQYDSRSSSGGALLARLNIKRMGGRSFVNYRVVSPYWTGPPDVEIPDDRPFLLETLWDQPNNLVSVWVDGVRYDRTVDLSIMPSLNAVSLRLYGVDSGTAGVLCYDEFAVDDQQIGPLPPPNTPPGLELTSGYSGQVYAGEVMTFTHILTNTGDNPDSFRVIAAPDLINWTIVVSPAIVGPLNARQSEQVLVTVQVPDDAISNTVGSVLVVATSQASSDVSVSVTDRFVVQPRPPGLELTSGYSGQVYVGEVMTFTHLLTNTADNPDSFRVIATPDLMDWTAVVSPAIVGPLNARQSEQVLVTVQVPDDAIGNTIGSALVVATSQASSTVSVSVADTVTVRPKPPGLELTSGYSGQVYAGEVMTFTHILTNTGDNPDSFRVTVIPEQPGWIIIPSSSTVGPLDARQSEQVSVAVQVPTDAISKTICSILVVATSQMNNTVSRVVTDTVAVLPTPTDDGLIHRLYLPVILHTSE